MIVGGIDMGYRDVKVLILKDGDILAKRKGAAGFEPNKVVEELIEGVLEDAGLSREEIESIGVTGSGRKFAPPHDMEMTDVGAAAKGASYVFPSARTVIDCGAEDTRVMKCVNGAARDFATNDKCAAGSGTFIETMTRTLELNSLDEFGNIALVSTEEVPINSQCVVFAESEVVSLIHAEKNKADIARAICDALGERTVALVQRIGAEKDIVLVGGMARIEGFTKALERGLRSEILKLEDPEYAGALGVAVAAEEKRQEKGG